jgi:hypothetical protein
MTSSLDWRLLLILDLYTLPGTCLWGQGGRAGSKEGKEAMLREELLEGREEEGRRGGAGAPSTAGSLPPHLNCTRISARRLSSALPALSKKGTPSQRALLIFIATAAKVGVRLPLGTVASSRSERGRRGRGSARSKG